MTQKVKISQLNHAFWLEVSEYFATMTTVLNAVTQVCSHYDVQVTAVTGHFSSGSITTDPENETHILFVLKYYT